LGQSYEENQVQKIFRGDLPYDFKKKAKSTFVPGFPILSNEQYHNFCLVTPGVAIYMLDLVELDRGEAKSSIWQ
jgi:hypothetical protein